MQQIGTIQTLQVGTPHEYGKDGAADELERPWTSSFFRVPSDKPRWLYVTHLEGNAQADTKNHGRLSQAVLLYAGQHYRLWQAELERPEIGPGGFGENLTVAGLSEATACVGDTYAVGDARIQVTGPRYPCWKISRRWGIPNLREQVASTGRTGWYCCVIQEGLLAPGMPIVLMDRPYPGWTMALINDFGHGRRTDRDLAEEIAGCPLLQEWWQRLVLRPAGGTE